MNSEQWVMFVIILLIIFLLLSNQSHQSHRHEAPKRILSGKELESFTLINPNTGELVIPSPAGVLIENSPSGQAVRVCGSTSSQATGLGKSANQVQIYTNGDPTAAFDTTGLYNKGIVEATGTFRSTGDSYSAGSGGPGLELSYVSSNDSCYATSINRTTGAFKQMNIQSSGFTVLCSPNAGVTQTTPLTCNSSSVVVGVPITTGTINNVQMWSQGVKSLVLNATHTSGGVYNGSGTANTGLGWNALSSSTTGGQNTAFGSGSLQSSTEGINNVAMGVNSLKTVTTGYNNVALGQAAGGTLLTIGYNNVYLGAFTNSSGPAVENEIAIGYGVTGIGSNTINIMNAIKYNINSNSMSIGGTASAGAINGTYNVFMGNSAGVSMHTTSQQNTGIGQGALYSCTTGSYNSSFGTNSFQSLTTGNNNTGLGLFAGRNLTTGSNNVYIGRESVASSGTATNEIVIGGGGTDSTTNTGKGSNTVSIGNSSTTNVFLNTTSGGTTVIGGHLQVGASASIYLTDTGGVTGTSVYGRYFSAGTGLYQDFTNFFNWRSCGVNGSSNMLSCMSLDLSGNLSVTNAINNVKMWSIGSQSLVLNATHSSGSV